MLVLGYKVIEFKKIKKFFEGMIDIVENYIKLVFKMLVKQEQSMIKCCFWVKMSNFFYIIYYDEEWGQFFYDD